MKVIKIISALLLTLTLPSCDREKVEVVDLIGTWNTTYQTNGPCHEVIKLEPNRAKGKMIITPSSILFNGEALSEHKGDCYTLQAKKPLSCIRNLCGKMTKSKLTNTLTSFYRGLSYQVEKVVVTVKTFEKNEIVIVITEPNISNVNTYLFKR